MFLRNVKPEVAAEKSPNGHDSFPGLDLKHLPRHIAIIMDGNRRWAKEQGWLAIKGHTVGADTTLNIIQECVDLAILALTLYTFST